MASSQLISSKDLTGQRIFGGKDGTKHIGKLRSCIFHPKERRCVGFIVKRPDLALMFHRSDLFVAIDGFDIVEGGLRLHEDAEATGNAASKKLGVNWDDCVLWVGLPVMTEDGTAYGRVGEVIFDRKTGEVAELRTDAGATSNVLLGKREIPAEYILGFRQGMGVELAAYGEEEEEAEDPVYGALLVSDEVRAIDTEGGLAEKAGNATAVAVDKVQSTVEKAKPQVKKATSAAGKAVNKGAYVTGRQIGRSKGMFAAFKEEYDKALKGDEPKKSSKKSK